MILCQELAHLGFVTDSIKIVLRQLVLAIVGQFFDNAKLKLFQCETFYLQHTVSNACSQCPRVGARLERLRLVVSELGFVFRYFRQYKRSADFHGDLLTYLPALYCDGVLPLEDSYICNTIYITFVSNKAKLIHICTIVLFNKLRFSVQSRVL